MPEYVAQIEVNGVVYKIKDAELWDKVQDVIDLLGNLAYKDTASGSFTPEGSVSTPVITVQTATTNINTLASRGTLPQWGASVNNETLTFNWNAGSLPTSSEVTVATGILSATSSKPTFTGKEGMVTVK